MDTGYTRAFGDTIRKVDANLIFVIMGLTAVN